jgi:hypothetical protein
MEQCGGTDCRRQPRLQFSGTTQVAAPLLPPALKVTEILAAGQGSDSIRADPNCAQQWFTNRQLQRARVYRAVVLL